MHYNNNTSNLPDYTKVIQAMIRHIHRIETVARVYGNSSHYIAPEQWLDKNIVCILLDDGFRDKEGRK